MKYNLINEKPDNRTLIEQILINRGIKQSEINHYLSASEKDLLSPLLLDNMERGAQMYIQHIAANDPLTMVVDPDVDGMTSAALFINYTYKLFPAYVQNSITYLCHTGKQHGLNDMKEWIPEDTKFLVMIDSSSNDYECHKYFAEKGVDILVIDHHEADKVSEYACVINNQLCGYPNKALSGVGVAYKFCCYLDNKLGIYNAYDLEDLVSLGLIADMVDTRTVETRYLITQGLKDIHNPLIKEIANRNSSRFEGGITPMGAAFYIAPFINAVMRSGTLEEKFLLFESLLEHKAYEEIPSTKRGCSGQYETRVEQAARMSSNVKARQKRAQDSGVEAIERLIQEKNLLDNKILFIKIEDSMLDRNLAGLVANQLVAKYQRPVAILRPTSYLDKPAWGGSMRGYEKSELKDFRAFLLSTGLVADCSGHSNAAGLTVYDNDFDALIDKTNEMLKDIDFSPAYQVDAIIDYVDLTDNIVFEIANWGELWGQNVEEPLIAIENVKADSNSFALIGTNQKTMRISVPEQRTNFIKFNLSEEEREELLSSESFNLNIIGRFALNYYMGSVSPQIQVVDYEIIKQRKWDF